MLYHFLYPLVETNSFFNVFKYISLRGSIAFISLGFFHICWEILYSVYGQKQFGQVVRDEGLKVIM